MKKHKSFFIFLIIVLVTLASLTGCTSGSYMTMMSRELHTANSWQMSYGSFSGTKSTTIPVKSGNLMILHIQVTTKEGNLKVNVLNQAGNLVYQVDTPKKSIRQVLTVTQNATYTLQISGKHKGGFKISWDILRS